MSLQQTLADLRAALPALPGAGELAPLYEHWVKQEDWQLHAEAIPLLVGLDPAFWPEAQTLPGVAAGVERLASALATQASQLPAAGTRIRPLALRAAADALGLTLLPELTRLLDFLARILPAQALPPGDAQAERAMAEAEDRLTLVGAALSLAVRQPASCLDAEGYFSAERMVQEIFRRAVFWFPLGPPSFSVDEAVALVARWLPARPERT